MSKIIRLTESDLVRLVKRVIKEQSEMGFEEKNLGSDAEKFVDDFLPKKGYKKMFNFPQVGHKFCNKNNSNIMGDCSAYQKGNQIIIFGVKGYCFLLPPPQGQTKNGPFTYKECMSFI